MAHALVAGSPTATATPEAVLPVLFRTTDHDHRTHGTGHHGEADRSRQQPGRSATAE